MRAVQIGITHTMKHTVEYGGHVAHVSDRENRVEHPALLAVLIIWPTSTCQCDDNGMDEMAYEGLTTAPDRES